MRKAGLFLLILIIVGAIGYLVLPKSKNFQESIKSISKSKVGNIINQESDSGVTGGARGDTATAEVAEGLSLTITSPTDKSTVNSPTLQVIGKTNPNAEVFVNDQEAKSDSTGNFFVNLILDEGENILTIVVNDDKGNYAERELTVYLESTE